MGRRARSLTCLVRDRSQRVASRRARRLWDRAQVRLDRLPDGLDEDDAVEQGYLVMGGEGSIRISRRADQARAIVKPGPRRVHNEEIASDAQRLGPRDERHARHAGLSLQQGIRVSDLRGGQCRPDELRASGSRSHPEGKRERRL
jgi:hypothetical protein